MTVTYRSQERSVVGTRQRKGQHGINVEILTRIRKANKSTSDDFVLITQRGSAMCTCAAFFWNYLESSALYFIC